jgi:maltose/moltooligosaccharide transporter
MSSIYKFLGASSSYISYLALAAPISGLIIQPIVGQLSDDTWSKYGKRKPYIFFWGILISISCIGLSLSPTLLLGSICLWILGCSVNGCVEALRALTADIVINPQKAMAFSIQTVFAGIGAGVAAILPLIFEKLPHINYLILQFNKIPYSIKLSFYFSAIVLIACMIWTLLKTKEEIHKHQNLFFKNRKYKTLSSQLKNVFHEIIINIKKMPPVIKEFSIIQIFTWIGLFGMWIYFSLAIAQHLFHLPAGFSIANNEKYANILKAATIQSGIYFSIYQFASVAFALIIPYFVKKFPEKYIHGISLILGAIGLIASSIVSNTIIITGCMILVGIMWGSIMTLPYSIVSEKLPKRKMAVYLGIFNISITLPQILAAFLMQPLYTFIFHKNAVLMIIFSGVLILISGIITLHELFPIFFKKMVIKYAKN